MTASNESKVYDNNSTTDPALAYTYTGLVNGDSSAGFTGGLTRAAGETAGSYAISRSSLAASGNYTIGTFAPGTFTITPAGNTISFPAPNAVVYGTAPFSIGSAASAGSGLPVSYTVLSGPGSLNGTTLTATGAGTIVIEATQAGNGNYVTAVPVIQTLTVTPAGLSVTATHASKTYGQADPSLTFTYSGLVNGDTAAGFIGAETYSGGPGVGNDTISQGTLTATGNYTITHFTTGAFTINPAPLTVTASNASKVYDDNSATDPALAYIYSGLTNGDSSASFTGSLTRAAGEGAGSYAISQGSLAATGNYTIGTFFPATFTITPASQTAITFAPIGAVTVGVTPLTLSATASSGLPVAFSVLSGPSALNGNTLTVTGAGSIVVEADQAGSTNVNAAPPVRETLTVYPAGTYALPMDLDSTPINSCVTTVVGKLQVAGGVVTGATTGVNFGTIGMTGAPDNVAMSAAVNLGSGTAAGLVLRYGGSADQNYYLGEIVLLNKVPTAAIYKNVNGTLTLLASEKLTATSGTLEFVAVGTSLKLLFNGALAAFTYDTTRPTGSIALRTQGGASIGSVAVSAITPATASLPFTDTFSAASPAGAPSDGAQLNSVWTAALGNFTTLSGGAAVGTASGVSLATVNLATPASTVTVSADVGLAVGTTVGLIARYSGSGDKNYYMAELTTVKGKPTVAIYRNVNGVLKLLASATVGATAGTLEFALTGNSLSLSFGGTPELQVTDSTFSTGTLGMRTTGGAELINFTAS